MSADVRRLLAWKTRTDLASFIHRTFQTVVPGQLYRHSWHIEAIAWHLQQCRERRSRRLIITMPPRSLKSICASVALPAFVLGHDPTERVVCVSYAQDLTLKHARDCRAVLESPWYRQLFPRTRLVDRLLRSRAHHVDHRLNQRPRCEILPGAALHLLGVPLEQAFVDRAFDVDPEADPGLAVNQRD